MKSDTGFDYALARIHAEYGRRADDETWRRLRATRTTGQLIAAARRSALARWVFGLDSVKEADELDWALRRSFSKHALEVSEWMPERWRASVAWLARLSELDARVVPSRAMATQWAQRFRERWPAMGPERRRSLEQIGARVAQHLERMASARPEADGWLLRAELERDLERCFRWTGPGPAAVYSYLGLSLLDLERLRSALIRRLVFPDVEGAQAWV